jgi:organic hydroperoxide reductase OsmC/OhrA
LESYESSAEGVLETTDDGLLFTSITIKPKVKLKNPEDADKVQAFLERAHKYCLISNSMKTEVRVEME